MRIYSNSLRTRVLVFSRCISALEMYFMATLWPVMVWVATKRRVSGACGSNVHDVLLTLPKVPSAISLMTVYSPSFDGGNISGRSAMAGGQEGKRWKCGG